jgi:hypothetical protein
MPCLPITLPSIPTIPSPLTLGIGLPSASFDPKLCCKLLPFPIVTPPIPLPPGVFNPAVVAVINAQLSALTATYFNLLPLKCPRE